jgi:hypothetical protein
VVKTEMLAFRVELEVKEALERAAKSDDRSVSGLAERVIRTWLIAEGYLPKPKE